VQNNRCSGGLWDEMDEEVWNHAVFSKNRERLLNEEMRKGFSGGDRTRQAFYCRMNILRWMGR